MLCGQASRFLNESQELATGSSLSYNEVYEQARTWRLLSPIDVPGAPERMLVSGTGLTHLGSAKDRQACIYKPRMTQTSQITDSMRMFEWGVKDGRPGGGNNRHRSGVVLQRRRWDVESALRASTRSLPR